MIVQWENEQNDSFKNEWNKFFWTIANRNKMG